MAEKNRRNKTYYIIAFLASTSYIWVLIISAYSKGIPQYNSLVYGILLMTAFTFIITVPLLYIGLPLICIGAVLAMFRIFSIKRMLTYYALSWLILRLALEIPLSIYGKHEENYIFTDQVKEAVEKNNGPIKITDKIKQSMLQWNEGTGSPQHPSLLIRYELLNCDKQKDEKIDGYSCTASIEAHYKQEKWLVDFDSKENEREMNLSKNNQQAEEKAKLAALTPEEETNIRKNAESDAIQFFKEKYNLNLTIVKQTFEKSINSSKTENRPSNPVHEIKINDF
ncbi:MULTISPECIES: hypothetical protein [Bacillus]|uniref:hypothetical protein n=1 Tax=Bacillus TaxID=1386 RepID=UPI000B03C017|nr:MULTISPECIES: hypothetical protein [Bacillus]MED1412504.1 hypothetical protein [Bacillus paramycoides]MED1466690.1 hypothetical protein [Bacillus paramycoides]MED1495521.1 hypothetical protein [Bacillus paramycoides]